MTNALPVVDPTDFLALHGLLSEEERMVAQTVRQLVTEKIKPNIGQWFEDNEFPREMAVEFGVVGCHRPGMHGAVVVARDHHANMKIPQDLDDFGAGSGAGVLGHGGSVRRAPGRFRGLNRRRNAKFPHGNRSLTAGCDALEPGSFRAG